jgi:hypothetical protein
MNYWRKNLIAEKQHQVLHLIYKYRSLTNEHLRRLMVGHLNSNQNGQKANISRYTADLKKKKFIESFSCYPYSKELIHCLTPKGIDYIKDFTYTDKNNPRAGFQDECLGDFDAAILRPGLKNIEHTMMFLEFAIKYRKLLDTRHNLYAVKKYIYYFDDFPNFFSPPKVGKVRPDGECIFNGKLFSIEIDTGSERHERLVEKFHNYKRYFDHCIYEGIDLPWYGILFVCKESHLEFERDQRLHTILKAACEGLQYYCWTIPLQIINRKEKKNLVLSKVLNDNHLQAELERFNIKIPQNQNPILDELTRLKKEEEERNRKIEYEKMQAVKLEKAKSEIEKLEYQKRMELEETRQKNEMEFKKKGFLGFWK